ncbi:hypothetical protein BCT27_12390 [Enterovibrio norvegicus]|nr:hypothetical protein BCT27_12390 [Enterovibrio norvegicus]
MKTEKRPVGRPKKEVTADKRVGLRVNSTQHQAWAEAAIRDGYEKGGEPNISGWLKDLADQKAKTPSQQ